MPSVSRRMASDFPRCCGVRSDRSRLHARTFRWLSHHAGNPHTETSTRPSAGCADADPRHHRCRTARRLTCARRDRRARCRGARESHQRLRTSRRCFCNHFRLRRHHLPGLTSDDLWPEVGELSQCRTMECCGRDLPGPEASESAAQFTCGLLRERDRQRTPGVMDAGSHRVRDAMCDRARLPCTRSRIDDDRTRRGHGHRPLVLVEPVQMHGGSLRSPPDIRLPA